MAKSGRKSKQGDFIDRLFSERSTEESVALPPTPSPFPGDEGGRGAARASRETGVTGEDQLVLPMETAHEPHGDTPAQHTRERRKGTRGFVPVMHDPDVARSYSDNIAMDHATARGLAQVLATMTPEELAALRAKVARAAEEGRNGPRRGSR